MSWSLTSGAASARPVRENTDGQPQRSFETRILERQQSPASIEIERKRNRLHRQRSAAVEQIVRGSVQGGHFPHEVGFVAFEPGHVCLAERAGLPHEEKTIAAADAERAL